MDYTKYYFLEDYLFSDVTAAFQTRGYLTPEEFFAIVIWKSNQAKTTIKKKLIKNDRDLATSVRTLTEQIYGATTDEERLRIFLEEWRFLLPMATAILAVLYPDRFTIYDIRVRKEFNIEDFAGNKDQITRYFKEFLPKVAAVTQAQTLRDKDRYLWGKSWYEDLQHLVRNP